MYRGHVFIIIFHKVNFFLTDLLVCVEPVDHGTCNLTFHRWFYDQISNSCHDFTFSGCDGNGNNFVSRRRCEEYCAGKENMGYYK